MSYNKTRKRTTARRYQTFQEGRISFINRFEKKAKKAGVLTSKLKRKISQAKKPVKFKPRIITRKK